MVSVDNATEHWSVEERVKYNRYLDEFPNFHPWNMFDNKRVPESDI